jgi:hypothetical protein
MAELHLTTEQAKLISLGMTIKMWENKLNMKWLSQFQEALFDKCRIQAENNYFDYWFELNREKLENDFLIKMLENWEEEQDVIDWIMLWNSKFTEYCLEKCFQNL